MVVATLALVVMAKRRRPDDFGVVVVVTSMPRYCEPNFSRKLEVRMFTCICTEVSVHRCGYVRAFGCSRALLMCVCAIGFACAHAQVALGSPVSAYLRSKFALTVAISVSASRVNSALVTGRVLVVALAIVDTVVAAAGVGAGVVVEARGRTGVVVGTGVGAGEVVVGRESDAGIVVGPGVVVTVSDSFWSR